MAAISTGYVDRDLLKQVLFLVGQTDWDDYLDLLIRSVGDTIDQFADRSFLTTGIDETRHFRGRGGQGLKLDDTYSVTSVKVDTTGDGVFDKTLVEGTDFDLLPLNDSVKTLAMLRAASSLAAFPHGSRVVEVVGIWGWSAVPGSVEQAALLTASRWFKRKETDFSEVKDKGATLLDADVIALLEPYRRRRETVLGLV